MMKVPVLSFSGSGILSDEISWKSFLLHQMQLGWASILGFFGAGGEIGHRWSHRQHEGLCVISLENQPKNTKQSKHEVRSVTHWGSKHGIEEVPKIKAIWK